MRVLVTGADGFVGRWLVSHLEEAGDEVLSACGQHATPHERTRSVDLRSRDQTGALLGWAQPEAIYHLAAVAFGPDVQRSPGEALEITIGGTLNVLEAAATLDRRPTVFIPSSGEVYGRPTTTRVLSEDDPIAPVSAYGSTKAAQELVAFAYHHAGVLPIVVARSFNHIGPGQREAFVVASFAKQLADIEAGRQEPVLRVGNLAPERDFTDVRDVVAAYRLLVVGGHVGGIFNVASGAAISIRTVLDRLIDLSGLEVRVEVDERRMRSVDPPRIVGNAELLRRTTGWAPRHSLDETLHDVWTAACARAAG